MKYIEQYGPFEELVKFGQQTIYTKDIDKGNINNYFSSIINIFKDGIDNIEVQNMMVHIVFQDNEDLDLSIFDFVYNLMFWQFNTTVGEPINSYHLIFWEDITKSNIKEYIDKVFVNRYRKKLPFIVMNQTIDAVIGKFRELRKFQLWLANTLNLKDTIDLMNQYPEFNKTVHFDPTGIPLEDVKDEGMKATNIQIEYIKNSNHCLRDSFRTGEANSPKQYKEVGVNIGSKPDGQGSVFPHPIKHSFMNGGLETPEEIFIESSVGRVAQILQKTNVGSSGAFARRLELNNQDTFLNPDPNYVCDTRNFEEIVIENKTMLRMIDMRYYRDNPKGIDKLCDCDKCSDLVGKKIYLRSPMTCASAARGMGVCYKCYGDLAYANQEINIGQIAAEALSSIYTQILLSAKHLLESLVIKMTWVDKFYELFQVTFNTIGLKETGVNYKGYKLIIDEEIRSNEEMDDVTYDYYINNFCVKDPQGNIYRIHTTELDDIYLTPDFMDFLNDSKRASNDDDVYEMDMLDLFDLPALFIVEVRNNELSRTMNQINKLIDNKTVISKYDRNSILREFIMTNISGGIKLNSVHFEILLMNQIRAADDELEMPNWTIPNAPYQILTLSKSLSENRSISVRLQSEKIASVLKNPQNRFLHQPAISDLFYMEQPQEYLEDDEDIISDEYKPKSDIETNIEQPITFDNPKVRVGRRIKKKKISRKEANKLL